MKVASRHVTHEAVLYRRNGRFVKVLGTGSKYAMKQVKDKAEDKYDLSYYIEVKPI